MAVVNPIIPGQEEAYRAWVESRPPLVREIVKKWPPMLLYRMTDTGQRVTIAGYSEDGTVTVNVTGEYNFVVVERSVFGVNPENLVECDLPDEGEILGTVLDNSTVEEVLKRTEEMRKAREAYKGN